MCSDVGLFKTMSQGDFVYLSALTRYFRTNMFAIKASLTTGTGEQDLASLRAL